MEDIKLQEIAVTKMQDLVAWYVLRDIKPSYLLIPDIQYQLIREKYKEKKIVHAKWEIRPLTKNGYKERK